MTKGPPDVSVIIPTYNRREFLEQAIASCLEDSDDVELEVIVVDDGSTDGTNDWLRAMYDPRVSPLGQHHLGPQVARNRGLDAATGRFVKFLDDDDWLAPGVLRREVACMDRTGADLCGGDALVWQDGEVVDRYGAPDGHDAYVGLVSGDATTHLLKFSMTRELAARVRFDEELRIRMDLDFMIRAAEIASAYCRLEGASGYFRQHPLPRISKALAREEAPLIHLQILCRSAKRLLETDPSGERTEALRLGLWRWIHLLYPSHPERCQEAWRLLQALDPGVQFEASWNNGALRVLGRAVGPMAVERILRYPRLLKARLVSIARGGPSATL